MDSVQTLQKIQINWRDIGSWNYYFFLKFALLWAGYLNFHPFTNLVFLAYLLLPLPSLFLHRCRNLIAIPIGILVFYHDTWLPNPSVLFNPETNPLAFSPNYLMELLNRFINWQLIGMAFVLFVAYLFVFQWVRLTVVTIGILFWFNISTVHGPNLAFTASQSQESTHNHRAILTTNTGKTDLNRDLPPTNDNLTSYLNQFYAQQQNLRSEFPKTLPTGSVPFDIILIQICSLAWSDVYATHLEDHPMWKKFDLMFEHFNSAASYSGPAAIRLLRASCGQTPHSELYKPVPEDCYLLDNLSRLGFNLDLMLDHDGSYGNFLDEIRKYGGLKQIPIEPRTGIQPDLVAFNGQLISNDGQMLSRWAKQITANKKPNATYFNTISMHDGNSYIGTDTTASYKEREIKLFDQINNFFTELEKSGRKTMVIFIPEHGANLEGDKLQMPGLRDIPSPSITHIPVGIKLIGLKSQSRIDSQIKIAQPSSYFALSELIARLINEKVFDEDIPNLNAISRGLPTTPFVSTNEGSTVMKYQDKYYILLKGENNWVPYP